MKYVLTMESIRLNIPDQYFNLQSRGVRFFTGLEGRRRDKVEPQRHRGHRGTRFFPWLGEDSQEKEAFVFYEEDADLERGL